MSRSLTMAVLEHSQTKGTDRMIMLALAYLQKGETVFSHSETLSEMAKVDKRSVARALSRIKNAKEPELIECDPLKTKNGEVRNWRINLPAATSKFWPNDWINLEYLNAVWKRSDSRGLMRLITLALAARADATGRASVRYADLSRMTGSWPSAICRAFAGLPLELGGPRDSDDLSECDPRPVRGGRVAVWDIKLPTDKDLRDE